MQVHQVVEAVGMGVEQELFNHHLAVAVVVHRISGLGVIPYQTEKLWQPVVEVLQAQALPFRMEVQVASQEEMDYMGDIISQTIVVPELIRLQEEMVQILDRVQMVILDLAVLHILAMEVEVVEVVILEEEEEEAEAEVGEVAGQIQLLH